MIETDPAQEFELTDDEVAERRFRSTQRYDPYAHHTKPALLNSSDIHHYAIATGMLSPYTRNRLKTASYSICIGRKIIYWDEKGNRIVKALKDRELFDLPRNSIVFVETLEKFRLPDYMAIRFNLKINLVHSGILLGTGPLVDPGFQGKLLIPLHNLTSNKYQFQSGDKFVWVEFTKISDHCLWKEPGIGSYSNSFSEYVSFPEIKKNMPAESYLRDAGVNEVRSSIPDTFHQTREDVRNMKYLNTAVVISGLLLAIGLLNLGMRALDLTETKLERLEEKVERLETRENIQLEFFSER